MELNAKSTVGNLAAKHPATTRVFHRHGIDFCCGGGKELKEVCETKGIDVDSILGEIRSELEKAPSEKRWDTAPLDSLISHILETFHGPLKEELPRLESMAEKVHKVHGDKDPDRLSELLMIFKGLKDELDSHMQKEEQILFPMIISGNGSMAQGPVSVMEQEHDSAGAALRRIRELTNGFTVPEEACTTWRALWHGLEQLEGQMHQHIHLENNILFPRALAG